MILRIGLSKAKAIFQEQMCDVSLILGPHGGYASLAWHILVLVDKGGVPLHGIRSSNLNEIGLGHYHGVRKISKELKERSAKALV